jgi:thiosulfate reductase cytochrome b subunit
MLASAPSDVNISLSAFIVSATPKLMRATIHRTKAAALANLSRRARGNSGGQGSGVSMARAYPARVRICGEWRDDPASGVTGMVSEMLRTGRFFPLVWIVPAALVLLVAIVLAARGIRATPDGRSFLEAFPGASGLPVGTPAGIPGWLAWQHGLNSFFLLFILRTGWIVRSRKRPTAFWRRNNSGLIRTSGSPVRIGIDVWLHLAFDALWMANGVLFYVLLFTTGQWARIIPTRLDVVPNAVSAALQYASLEWPTENGWSNYNALQLLSYFVIVFIAAPVALFTGIRLAPGFAVRLRPLDRVLPPRPTRTIHFVTMLVFAGFIVVHVTLVLTTGAINNLNHMYAVNNGFGWVGLVIFSASIVLMAVAWFALSPTVVRTLAGLTGTVRR